MDTYDLALFNNNIEVNTKSVASYIIIRDLAKAHYINKEYDKCIEMCNSLYLAKGNYLSIGQMASEYTFRSYVDSNQKMDAIEFYVDRYIQKRALVNSIQTKNFMELLRKERYKSNVRNTIELQIFVFLNAFEDEQKAHVLQMFMNYLDAISMSSLIDEIKDTIQQEKPEIFLFSLVESDVLRHLPYIGSTKQMLEEQQAVVQYLSLLDSPKRNLYEEYNKQILELMISYEKGCLYIIDKAYMKTIGLFTIEKAKAFFIVPIKRNVKYLVLKDDTEHSNPIEVIADRTIEFTSRWAKAGYPRKLRLVTYYVEEKGKPCSS